MVSRHASAQSGAYFASQILEMYAEQVPDVLDGRRAALRDIA